MSFPFGTVVSLIWVAWLLHWCVSAFGTRRAVRVGGLGTMLVHRVPRVIVFIPVFMRPPVFAAAASRSKLRHEEAWMRERLGAAYVDYMRHTKALLPGLL